MGAFDELMWHFDEGVTGLFSQWNGYTSAITTLLVLLVTYRILARTDPDVHPMLLARQAAPSLVRQEGESPVYRAFATPHGMPLNTGLNVVDPGASKWSQGRDGDLRDVWRQAVSGTNKDGKVVGTGKILTVVGRENVIEQKLDGFTRQIILTGQHIRNSGGNNVAIYLPNSVEFLAALFACAFYDLTAILIPYQQTPNGTESTIIEMLRKSAADTIVTSPGAFPFDEAVKTYPALKQVIWVLDEGNAHLDWNEIPKGAGGKVNVTTWQDILQDSSADASPELPPLQGQKDARDVTIFWGGIKPEMVRFTSANLVSAISGQLFAIPVSQRMGPSDLFLPADSLTNAYTLILTLTALYSNASIALNSIAGNGADLSVATMGIAPTVIVTTPKTLLATHGEYMSHTLASFLAKFFHGLLKRSLVQDAVMPAAASLTSRLNDVFKPALSRTPGKLRLIYTAEQASSTTSAVPSTMKLSSEVLADLRILTGARIVYALTTAKVAGAVAQTGFYDYRVFEDVCSHFGPPLTSTEVLLRSSDASEGLDESSMGEIMVRGPCVVGGEATLGVNGKIRFDNTLAYL